MPLWLLGIGGTLKDAASAAFGWIGRYPWQFACLALLLACGWLWHGRSTARADLAQHIAAEKAATGAQKAVNAAATQHYQEAANVADTKHDAMVADAFDATARFVAEHRLQPADRTCQAPAPAASGDPEVHIELPKAGVVVAESDVQNCAAWQAYGVAANSWAQSLKLPE